MIDFNQNFEDTKTYISKRTSDKKVEEFHSILKI